MRKSLFLFMLRHLRHLPHIHHHTRAKGSDYLPKCDSRESDTGKLSQVSQSLGSFLRPAGRGVHGAPDAQSLVRI